MLPKSRSCFLPNLNYMKYALKYLKEQLITLKQIQLQKANKNCLLNLLYHYETSACNQCSTMVDFFATKVIKFQGFHFTSNTNEECMSLVKPSCQFATLLREYSLWNRSDDKKQTTFPIIWLLLIGCILCRSFGFLFTSGLLSSNFRPHIF